MKSSAVTQGWGSKYVTQQLGESGMKRLGQNKEHVSAPPCCRGDLCAAEKDHEGPQCQRLGGGEPEKQGLVRVGGHGVWLCGGRAAGLCTTPVKPAQLQALSLGRHFVLFQFVV